MIYLTYEDLLIEADENNLITKEKPLRAYDGRIKGSRIAIRKDLATSKEKKCVLAEELGHYYTSVGDILNLSDKNNCKQEAIARSWAYRKIITLDGIIDAYECGCTNRYELAEHLNVTEEFLLNGISELERKHGYRVIMDNYMIQFSPLAVYRFFNE